MRGLWLENKELTLRDNIQQPEKPAGEILVKVLRSGICNTDAELIKGYYPYQGVLGHEFVGVVVDENAPEELKGKRVVGEINCVCHSCDFCAKGLKNHCANRTVMGIVNRWGTHAELLTLPKENLFVVPDEVSTEDACFVEPLAAALQLQQQIDINPSHKVAVIGDGKLGLLIAKTVSLTGCNLKVYGHHKDKLALLTNDNIVVESNPPSEKELDSYDIVIEGTGNKVAFQQAINILKPRGVLVMKSTHEGSIEINCAPIVVKELTLVGSRCGPFQKAIDFLASKKINLDGMLVAKYPLKEGLKAFEHAQRKGVLKIQLIMDENIH